MIRNTLYLLLTLCFISISNSDEYLISVENLPLDQRLSYPIVHFSEPFYFILAKDTHLQQLSHKRIPFITLEKNPLQTPGKVFLLFPFAETIQTIGKSAKILQAYDNFLIVRVLFEQEEKFFGLKCEKMLIDFQPFIFNDVIPEELLYRTPVSNKLTEEMVSKISKDSLRSYVTVLQNFKSRHASENKDIAIPWIVQQFKANGADSVFTQETTSGCGPNVVAILKGSNLNASEYCLMGGHLDGAVKGGSKAAGADDNASGTAAALEAIRVLRGYTFQNDIRCVAFNGEETGFQGSSAYAKDAKKNNHKIIGGFINLDMIGYSKTTPTLHIHYQTTPAGNKEFGALFKSTAEKYLDLAIKIVGSSTISGASDHASFNSSGYVAFMAIETADRNGLCPNYHKAGDLLDDAGGLNNSDFMTSSCKAAVSVISELAKPVSTSISEPATLSKPMKVGVAISKTSLSLSTIVLSIPLESQSVQTYVTVHTLQGRRIPLIINKSYIQASKEMVYTFSIPQSGTYIIKSNIGSTVYTKKIFIF